MARRKKWVSRVGKSLAVLALVCALPWTPLWTPILLVGYFPVLCLLNVDHWFSASGTLVLSDGTGADLSNADDPARQAEIDAMRENQRRFNTDREFVEMLARKNHRLFPGEVVFVFGK